MRHLFGHSNANVLGIFSMWTTWTIGFGAIVVVLIVSLYVSVIWLPIVSLLCELLVFMLIRHNRVSSTPMCYLLPFIVTRILFWSTIVMIVINMLNYYHVLHRFFNPETINQQIPFVILLIISPISFLVSVWADKRGQSITFCDDCIIRHGTSAERGFLGNMFSQEAQYQVKLFVLLFAVLTIISWCYYFFFYVNVNFNTIDCFVFVWFPVILFLITIIYLGIRYFTLWIYYCQDLEGSVVRNGSYSVLRYIVFCGDSVFLKKPDYNRDDYRMLDQRYDTPAKLTIEYNSKLSEYDSEIYLKGLTGLTQYELRLLYVNSNFRVDCNIYHFACFVESEEQVANSRMEGEWFTLPELNKLIEENNLSNIFISEYNRIYNISMAWKSYDRQGRRLYSMRNYIPTFRLQDIKDWDVDYNDIEWLFVAKNNQDRSFYRIKRFWRRVINGEGY